MTNVSNSEKIKINGFDDFKKIIDNSVLFNSDGEIIAEDDNLVSKKYKNIIESSTKFNDLFNVILEDSKLSIDIPEDTINFLLKVRNNYIPSRVFIDIIKKSKHFNNVKYNNNYFKKNQSKAYCALYIGVFNFHDYGEILEYITKCYKVTDNAKIIDMINYFINTVTKKHAERSL